MLLTFSPKCATIIEKGLKPALLVWGLSLAPIKVVVLTSTFRDEFVADDTFFRYNSHRKGKIMPVLSYDIAGALFADTDKVLDWSLSCQSHHNEGMTIEISLTFEAEDHEIKVFEKSSMAEHLIRELLIGVVGYEPYDDVLCTPVENLGLHDSVVAQLKNTRIDSVRDLVVFDCGDLADFKFKKVEIEAIEEALAGLNVGLKERYV